MRRSIRKFIDEASFTKILKQLNKPHYFSDKECGYARRQLFALLKNEETIKNAVENYLPECLYMFYFQTEVCRDLMNKARFLEKDIATVLKKIKDEPTLDQVKKIIRPFQIKEKKKVSFFPFLEMMTR